jgi:hypothetical protein
MMGTKANAVKDLLRLTEIATNLCDPTEKETINEITELEISLLKYIQEA